MAGAPELVKEQGERAGKEGSLCIHTHPCINTHTHVYKLTSLCFSLSYEPLLSLSFLLSVFYYFSSFISGCLLTSMLLFFLSSSLPPPVVYSSSSSTSLHGSFLIYSRHVLTHTHTLAFISYFYYSFSMYRYLPLCDTYNCLQYSYSNMLYRLVDQEQ